MSRLFADIDYQSSDDGSTALHLAAFHGHLHATKLLLSHGANMTITNNAGRPPRAEAERKGHGEVARAITLWMQNPQQQLLLHKALEEAERERARAREAKSGQEQTQWALEKQNSSHESTISCIVCLDEPKQVLLLPCKHLCVCNSCAVILQQQPPFLCPICRASVEDTMGGIFA